MAECLTCFQPVILFAVLGGRDLVGGEISLGAGQHRRILGAGCSRLSLQDSGEEAPAIAPKIVGRLESNSIQRSVKKASYPKNSNAFSKQLVFMYG